MQPEISIKEKVKIISLYDEKRNCQDKFALSLNLLGEGKYGKVYKATHVDKPDLIFAVKVIELVSEKVRKECLKELSIIKHLPSSPNLVKIHQQHLESENNLYIFEEYCDGGNMAEFKASEAGKFLTEENIFDIFFQIVSGFLQLRNAGVFHEDIKPQNILKKNNILKFTDFGISQLADNYQKSIVRKGTLSYMPPEKLKPDNYIPTSKSQIFSLGVTLYEIIFGSHPYLKKRLSDYKAYLKEIANAKLKSIDELKAKFNDASICLDKLIRIIFRMIDLNEAKRLSLDELKDYFHNSEPFKSMKILERKENKVPEKKKKYDVVGHSKIFVKGNEGLRDSLKENLNSSRSADHQILKYYMKFFRDASSFLLQGLSYAKRSNLYELKKHMIIPDFSGNESMQRIDYLEFSINFYNDFGFGETAKKYNDFIYLLSQQEESICGIENDVQFIKNQFLKVFMDSPIQEKKQLRQYFKIQQNQLAHLLSETLEEIFNEINCVRVNFKDDLLAVIFLKDSSKVVRCLRKIIEECIKGEFEAKNMVSSQIEKAKKIIEDFNKSEIEKTGKLAALLEEQMKNEHQMLYDIVTNSDEFEILDFDEND